ncbi:hypothetical protein P9277_23395 [Schinkia azotoformans]|uniref:hypothetical protein n=1 Tax=Schinkia azotoformans TaxID=1454 RepID=UPI002E20DF94|nr:hypothetical protein [Schinkia azotoformans]
MDKKVSLISVFFSILIFCLMDGQSYAAELEVGKDKMYETISSAIEQDGNGDIIKVYPGN